ncbi:MAG: hypothetical protein HFI93_07210 [Lachnospiraceae bacterium]|nr:hypothetical protein [Lachnospiraceae bacterium]
MKAVYYICTNRNWGYVAPKVWDILEEEGYFTEKTGIRFFGQDVTAYSKNGHHFLFVPMDYAVCLDYPRFLPEMNQYFRDCDVAAQVTWHEGEHAPENVLTVHSLGDMESGRFGPAVPRLMRNLLLAFEANRQALKLDDYRVTTEATHWSGVYAGHGDPDLLLQYPVPMMDIEVGSAPESWNCEAACRALARTLTRIFDDDGRTVRNILCVGGVHFDPNFSAAVFQNFQNEAFGVSHIMANQWLVSGRYENETGFERACRCVDSIKDGVEAIFFHDKLKGCYKDLVRRLGVHYEIPIYKHQKLRTPEEICWKV